VLTGTVQLSWRVPPLIGSGQTGCRLQIPAAHTNCRSSFGSIDRLSERERRTLVEGKSTRPFGRRREEDPTQAKAWARIPRPFGPTNRQSGKFSRSLEPPHTACLQGSLLLTECRRGRADKPPVRQVLTVVGTSAYCMALSSVLRNGMGTVGPTNRQLGRVLIAIGTAVYRELPRPSSSVLRTTADESDQQTVSPA
jgi:hypothetical protein